MRFNNNTLVMNSDYSNGMISIVVPAYNEEEVLPLFHQRLKDVLDSNNILSEIIYVNDGSTDGTLNVLKELQRIHRNVAIVDLSRNFGKETAMTAGLDHADGDAVVIIDADLQDPPELIPEFIEQWKNGYDVVYAKRMKRDGETALKKASSYAFYRVIQRLSRVRIPEDTGDYRLLSRRAAEALRKLREQHRFMKGLFAWIGYPQKAVLYNRDPRKAGKTKWNYWNLWNFALEGITAFTSLPLRISTYLGFVTALFGFLYAFFIAMKALLYGDPVRGFPSLIVIITLLGGIQLVGIGIIGEYLGRMFDETKNRPLYFVNACYPSRPRSANHSNNGNSLGRETDIEKTLV